MSLSAANRVRSWSWARWLPALGWLRTYDRSWLRGDLVAAITLAAYLLPAGLGDASLANLPPEAGLYACLFGGRVFWLFCSSRHTAITVTSAIHTMNRPNPNRPQTLSPKPMSSRFASFFSRTFPCVLLALALADCKSASGPGSASFASVTIKNHTPAEIHAAAAEIFQADGYAAFQPAPDRMVFEKEASRLASLSRDGLVATQGGARTIERVRTELVDLGGGTYRLQCQAFMVSGAGDSFFENEVAKTHMRAGPYRSLMNKVGKKLK